MIGETVVVLDRKQVGVDGFNNPIWEDEPVNVANVLVAPVDGEDNIATTRPEGTRVRYTLYFPKTFEDELEGLKIIVRGEQLRVIGKPDHYDPVNCPTKWWQVVKVGVLHG